MGSAHNRVRSKKLHKGGAGMVILRNTVAHLDGTTRTDAYSGGVYTLLCSFSRVLERDTHTQNCCNVVSGTQRLYSARSHPRLG
jgi:hypothetical protein